MIILPAIDLYNGKAVRLSRGDYDQMTVYSGDPVFVARGFMDAGAEMIHVVDLEGARGGVPVNFETIQKIAAVGGAGIEAGGGIRSADVIDKYLGAGVKRVVLGTAAVTEPGFVTEAARAFGDAVAVGVDIRDGRVAIKGWTEVSGLEALDFCLELSAAGVCTIVCTDISKDGMLGGANIGLYREMREKLSVNLIASGGVSTYGDIEALSALGLDGAIIGKALYTGDIDLTEAIRSAK